MNVLITRVWRNERDNLRAFKGFARQVAGTAKRQQQIWSYLYSGITPKLHLGACDNILAGWLKTDSTPASSGIVFLNAVCRFPFSNNVFAYVFSEHMIEHVPYSAGAAMLRECFRVLRPGGRIRIATPDLRKLAALATIEGDQRNGRYTDWALSYNNLPRIGTASCFVVNHFVRSWGHEFIYDEDTLSATLTGAGFESVRRCEPGISCDVELSNLEHHDRVVGFENNQFETMVLEAVNP